MTEDPTQPNPMDDLVCGHCGKVYPTSDEAWNCNCLVDDGYLDDMKARFSAGGRSKARAKREPVTKEDIDADRVVYPEYEYWSDRGRYGQRFYAADLYWASQAEWIENPVESRIGRLNSGGYLLLCNKYDEEMMMRWADWLRGRQWRRMWRSLVTILLVNIVFDAAVAGSWIFALPIFLVWLGVVSFRTHFCTKRFKAAQKAQHITATTGEPQWLEIPGNYPPHWKPYADKAIADMHSRRR